MRDPQRLTTYGPPGPVKGIALPFFFLPLPGDLSNWCSFVIMLSLWSVYVSFRRFSPYLYVDSDWCRRFIRIPSTLLRVSFLCLISPSCLWSWALLDKPLVAQLLNLLTFYGTRRFITLFTGALHWSLSWVRSIQSIPPPSYLKIHLNSLPLTCRSS
jgi:hypothetical protein